MTSAKRPARGFVNVFLSLVLALGLLPVLPAAAAAEEPANLGSVHVIVENTTCPKPAAAWTGVLVDTDVDLTADCTMMDCVKRAIEESGHTQVGADNGYISSIDGLEEHDGDDYDPDGKGYSGWMGTLNDWFTDMGFASFSVANGKLADGDEIRVMYTCTMYDLGNPESTDKTLKGIEFSAGTLEPAFSKDVHDYTLTVPVGTGTIKVAPTAFNKNYQVRTFIGTSQYKRTVEIPVSEGDLIVVKSGYANMDEADDSEGVESYSFAVVFGQPEAPEIEPVATGVEYGAAWAFYEDGTLVFAPLPGADGAMTDGGQFYTTAYVSKYAKKVKRIVFSEGITYIGNYVITGLAKAESVHLPSTLVNFGRYAFSGASAVKEFECAAGGEVSVSGNYLLKNNGKTLAWVIDKSKLSGHVDVPQGVTDIGDIFRECAEITSISLPAGLTKMGDWAFYGCAGLTEIEIPCNIISGAPFVRCTNLSEVTFAEGVTRVSCGFTRCPSLATVNFPASLEEFSGTAFDSTVTSFNFAEGGAFSVQSGMIVKKVGGGLRIIKCFDPSQCIDREGILSLLPETVEIGEGAFSGITDIEAVEIPSTVRSIGAKAFYGCQNLKGNLAIPDSVEEIGEYAFYETGLGAVSIPSGVSLGGQCFSHSGIREVTLGSDGAIFAFSICPNLQRVTVLEGVTSLGDRCFQDCSALTEVALPASMTEFDPNAFLGCDALTTLSFGQGSMFSLRDGLVIDGAAGRLLYALPALSENVAIPEGITVIGDYAFAGRKGIASVVLPAGLERIGASAFYACTGLRGELIIPSSVTEIGKQAFSDCAGISKVVCLSDPDVTEVDYGQEAFANMSSLVEFQFPASLSEYDRLLYGCSSITELELPRSVTRLGDDGYNFAYMSSLRALIVPDTIADWHSHDISQCASLETLSITGVRDLPEYSLYGTSTLKEVYLSGSLTSFGRTSGTFPCLIYYPGTMDEWNSISFGKDVVSKIEENTTVVVDYRESDEELPIIGQPQDETFYLGLEGVALSFEVQADEGDSVFYFWYDESGKCVSVGQQFVFSAAEQGEYKFFCIAKRVRGGAVSIATSRWSTVSVAGIEGVFPGEGTQESPYEIRDAAALVQFRNIVNGGGNFEGVCFALTADVELPQDWRPVGCTIDGSVDIKKGNNLHAFSGVFDGCGHTVAVPAGGLPLFGYVNGATIKNLSVYGERIEGYGLVNSFSGIGLNGVGVTVENVTLLSGTNTLKSGFLGGEITTNAYAGVSTGFTAVIRDCTIEEGVVVGYAGNQRCIGSFAGRFQGIIENCASGATVEGLSYVGGIVGTRDNAMGTCVVSSCEFSGSVLGESYVGGIVGGGYSDSSAPNGIRPSIVNCKATGSVMGTDYVGGILGGDPYVAQAWNAYSISGNVFAGKVSGDSCVGAIIGYYDSLNVFDDIHDNLFLPNCGAAKGIGQVWVVDTSFASPAAVDGVVYVNTKNGTSLCPYVTGCGWKAGYNRSDDPLGRDAELLCRALPYVEIEALPRTRAVRVGETLTVDIVVKANTGLLSMDLELCFGQDELKLVGVERGRGLSDGATLSCESDSAGAHLGLSGDIAFSDDGIVVATLTFEALNPADRAPLAIERLNAVAVDDGRLGDDSISWFVGDAGIAASDALLGDANGNGRVNIVDAQIVYDLSAGKYGERYAAYPLPDGWSMATLLWASNVNGDDQIDAVDAFAIQRYVHYGRAEGWS